MVIRDGCDGEDMLARHTLNSGMTEISQHNRALVHVNRGTVRLGNGLYVRE